MSSSRVLPCVFTHSSRPEWGRAVVAEELADRTTYVFENAGERTFLNEPSRLQEIDLPAEEREALVKSLLRSRTPARGSARPKKKRAPAKKKKKAVAVEAAAEADES